MDELIVINQNDRNAIKYRIVCQTSEAAGLQCHRGTSPTPSSHQHHSVSTKPGHSPTIVAKITFLLFLGSRMKATVTTAITTPVIPIALKANLQVFPSSLKTAEILAEIASPTYTPT